MFLNLIDYKKMTHNQVGDVFQAIERNRINKWRDKNYFRL